MGIDFNQLNGEQRKTLRQALMGAFGKSKELDRFLQDHDFEPLEYYSTAGNLTDLVFDLVEELSRTGQLGKLMAGVLDEREEYPALKDLESRLRAESTKTEESLLEGRVLQRQNPYSTAEEARSSVNVEIRGKLEGISLLEAGAEVTKALEGVSFKLTKLAFDSEGER